MARRQIELGEHGDIETTPQVNVNGRWTRSDNARKAERHKARVYFRGWDGIRYEVTATGKTKREATQRVQDRLTERLQASGSDSTYSASTALVQVGKVWLDQISRKGSNLSQSTVNQYANAWARYVDVKGSPVRGLTLGQVNDPQRVRGFLQHVADHNGTGAAKLSRSVLSGIINLAVTDGVLPANAVRQVRRVEASTTKDTERENTRAFTREQRDKVIVHAYDLAQAQSLDPRTVRKRYAVADLMAFMAGTGVRIDEARSLPWSAVDLDARTALIEGTKSDAARRSVTLPRWLAERLQDRAERTGTDGLVFSSPAHLGEPGRKWDEANSAHALRATLDSAGYAWAVPHTFRRTVASIAHSEGIPMGEIADQLGHADVSMTLSTYIGRDSHGRRDDLADAL